MIVKEGMELTQLSALESGIEKLSPLFSAATEEELEQAGGGEACRLNEEERDALRALFHEVRHHRANATSNREEDDPDSYRSDVAEGDRSNADVLPASGSTMQPESASRGNVFAAESMAAAAIQSAESAREAAASVVRDMDAILAAAKSDKKSVKKRVEKRDDMSGEGREGGGEGVGGEIGGPDEMGEMSQSMRDWKAEKEGMKPETRKVVEKAEEEGNETRSMRRAVIRIQHQNNVTHGVLAFMVVFSMVWRFGTMAAIHNMQRTFTRPFDAIGNSFSGIFRWRKGNKDRVSVEGPDSAFEGIIPSFSSDEDSNTQAAVRNQEAKEKKGNDNVFANIMGSMDGLQ